MIHSMLLSKLPSLTRFSSQSFTSHWCTKKITFLYFWQCFYNKWLISQRFLTSIDCVPYTSQSNILTNPFSYESIVVQRTHNTFTKSSRCAGITTFLISAKSYSRFIVNYPSYLQIHISQAPTSTSVFIFQDGGWTLCSNIGLSSLIPLTSASTWTKGAWTLQTVETKGMKGTISHVLTCQRGLLVQCMRCGVHPSGISVHSTYNPQHYQHIMA